MATLLLVRHAAAEQRDPRQWPDDAERPLTKKGIRRFRSMIDALDLPPVSRILSSRYVRAWETAEILADHVGGQAERCTALEEQGIDAMLQAARIAFAGGDEVVVMVGHEPFMSAMAGLLLCGPGSPARLRMRKGAIACFEVAAGLEAGTASLEWLAVPALIAE